MAALDNTSVSRKRTNDQKVFTPGIFTVNQKWAPMALFLFVAMCWLINPFSFISDDSYFYLVIARNIVLYGEQTFSGLFPTNGFHPLWLYILTLYSWVIAFINPDWLYHVRFAVPLSLAFLGLGMINFLAVARHMKIEWLPIVVIPVGFLSAFGVLYSEAHLLFFSISMLTLVSIHGTIETRFGPILHGLASAMVFLSRLDMVFFVIAIYIWLLVVKATSRKQVILSGIVFLVISSPYIVSNILLFGGITPVSGWLKSSFPTLNFTGLSYDGGLTLAISGYSVLFGFLPVAVSLALILLLRKNLSTDNTIIYAFCVGTLLHCFYITFFVGGGHSYYWYYVLPVISGALSLALLMKHLPRLNMLALLIVIGFTIFCSAMLIDKGLGFIFPRPDIISVRIIEEVTDYMQTNDIEDDVILVSDMPGRIAFFSNNAIIAVDMLTANRAFVHDMLEESNAFEYLATYCEEANRPITYVFQVGGNFLVSTDNNTSLEYIHPHLWNDTVIGERYVGEPIYVSPYLTVWEW